MIFDIFLNIKYEFRTLKYLKQIKSLKKNQFIIIRTLNCDRIKMNTSEFKSDYIPQMCYRYNVPVKVLTNSIILKKNKQYLFKKNYKKNEIFNINISENFITNPVYFLFSFNIIKFENENDFKYFSFLIKN